MLLQYTTLHNLCYRPCMTSRWLDIGKVLFLLHIILWTETKSRLKKKENEKNQQVQSKHCSISHQIRQDLSNACVNVVVGSKFLASTKNKLNFQSLFMQFWKSNQVQLIWGYSIKDHFLVVGLTPQPSS